ncbi:RNA-binding protein [Virgibacillus soli]|uniref:YlmH/Sll1252 family protein n=1 Tax=Paracerasibacillus soli TaxID=480284 RepID=A0ABU5CP38_9BACI|nr:YlmH/Sll1252 family protein [Virgibacillus soli]MDY0408114.1 YlmH/Sll1252 family protein [Virgibacillus soli]
MSIYQHFRKEEHAFIDQVLSWMEMVENSYIPRLSDFLDPRQQQIVSMLIGTKQADLQAELYGGGTYTERKRVWIAPFYDEINEDLFQLTLLQAKYTEKFVTLTHRDVLGAFLSLGLAREKLGDILVGDGLIQLIVASEIAPFIEMNLTEIKNAKITIQHKPLEDLLEKKLNWIESNQTVASLRLDNVLKEIYRISRKDAVDFIQKQYVKVNFKLVTDPKFIIEAGDMISLRRKGRSKLVQINDKTRKGNIHITTARLE